MDISAPFLSSSSPSEVSSDSESEDEGYVVSAENNNNNNNRLLLTTASTTNVNDRRHSTVRLSGHRLTSDDVDNHLRQRTACNSDDPSPVRRLFLERNDIHTVPDVIISRSSRISSSLTVLDLSNNQIRNIPVGFGTQLNKLIRLELRNNYINDKGVPDDFGRLNRLVDLNMSGNKLADIPLPVLQLTKLRHLSMGGNRIERIDPQIRELGRLRSLFLSGNLLNCLPSEIGLLAQLKSLMISHNRLEFLPSSMASLRRLQILHLHNNCLTTLPHTLVHLRSLTELSLRDNPLVTRFIRTRPFAPASLKELAGRSLVLCSMANRDRRVLQCPNAVKSEFIGHRIPVTLNSFLRSAECCVNPDCNGVYFVSKVEQVKFVDFCGRYRIPLMQYLCSLQCSTVASIDAVAENDSEERRLLQRVLLG